MSTKISIITILFLLHDLDECGLKSSGTECSNTSICLNTHGSFVCVCLPGYFQNVSNSNSIVCEDIDECQSTCNWDHNNCSNTVGSYLCSCESGYGLNENKTSCVDINECLSTCNWNLSNCSNTIGSYLCTCEIGYELNENKTSCVDIDECKTVCNYGKNPCTNTIGSYSCLCQNGYELTESDSTDCVDVDECKYTCNWTNSNCENLNGSYNCSCKSGFELDAANALCRDVNECATTCNWDYSYCNNTIGSYECSCDVGLQLNATNRSCDDINECEDKPCNWTNGVCNNLFRGFNCSCEEGWKLSERNASCVGPAYAAVTSNSIKVPYVDFKVAVEYVDVIVQQLSEISFPIEDPSKITDDDIDKNRYRCRRTNRFNPNVTKTVTIGAGSKSNRQRRSSPLDNSPLEGGEVYTVFLRGYTESGFALTSPYYPPVVTSDLGSPCHALSCFSYKNQACQLVNSTYANCFCKNGFTSFDNLTTCEDIDDCKSGTETCNKDNSKCINTKGGFNCFCIDGWKLSDDQESCVDVNECDNYCKYGVCFNSIGSFQCQCPMGSFYNATSNLCQDSDECQTNQHQCDPVREICHNENVLQTNKTYNCSCRPGWELSNIGNVCVDTNECLTLCRENNTLCKNTEGSYNCICALGFQYNITTHQCEMVDLCTKEFACPVNTSCSVISPGHLNCECQAGFMLNPLSFCEEIDECSLTPVKCNKSHEMCKNVDGGPGTICVCREGFERLGNYCEEVAVNECKKAESLNLSICPLGQSCVDTNSSFDCVCAAGYVKNAFDQCEDVNECETENTCSQDSKCININGSYVCECYSGYYRDNATNPLSKRCFEISFWKPWEQVGRCSQLCQSNSIQGKLSFKRVCERSGPEICVGEDKKEEFCNTEFCDNKLTILKSPLCEKWENMEDTVLSLKDDDIAWLKKLRMWVGLRLKGFDCKGNADAALYINKNLEKLQNDIVSLKGVRTSLQNIIDCNSYIKKKTILFQKYFSVQSRLVMYTSLKAAFKKLQARLSLKQQDCVLDIGLADVYASYIPKKFAIIY